MAAQVACSAADVGGESRHADASPSVDGGGAAGSSAGGPAVGGGAGAGGHSRSRMPLVNHHRWTLVSASEDPFQDRPGPLLCATNAYFPAELAGEETFEIETVRCNYLTVVQPTLADVLPGDRVVARIWRFELTNTESAEAHVAVMLGGDVAWQARVPIPSGSGLLSPEWLASRELPAGTPVHFHLHNHGANSWSLIELSVGPE